MFRRAFSIFGLFALFGMMLVPIMATVAPIVEGSLLPVSTPARLDTVLPEGLYRSRIWGHAEKKRECSFKRLEWFYAPRLGLPVVAPVKFLAGTKSRGNGTFDFGPWVVDVSEDQIEESYAYAFHSCHPFWEVRSLFFKGKFSQ